MTTTEKRIDELFYELVPFEGKCESLAGEIIRAFCRINYRYYNDGDQIGVGYGNETCNAPARFLEANCNDSIKEVVRSMWNSLFGYESKLEILSELILEFIENNPDLKHTETVDMFDFTLKEDYDYCDEWEDEEEDYWEDEEDEDYWD